MKYQVQIENKSYHLEVVNSTSDLKLYYNGKPIEFDYFQIHPAGLYSIIIKGKQYRIWLDPKENGNYHVYLNHQLLKTAVEDERKILRKALRASQKEKSGLTKIKAPMPGLVVQVEVESETSVVPGQGLVIVEAMKMENEIKSPVAGKVKKLHVKQGDAIEKDALLLEIIEE
jgi:biotin carboxyl carrier protein